MLYQVMQRHNFLPEAFTTDFQVHWGQHPLRPEFVESTYFLYRATGDPYYLEAITLKLNTVFYVIYDGADIFCRPGRK